ncbi:MAG TPA: APC family permease [Streptosporangiaceae bacterium]|jgi:amino acid transporter
MVTNVVLEPRPLAHKGLQAGALGLISSVVIAVSSTAPAYSMAATLGLIVALVGVHSPGTLIVSFLPMLCIAYAFRELNKVDPDCGTTFTWTTRAFGPRTGWMGGWGIIAADVIVMASLSQIAGRYALLLVGANGLATQTPWVTAVGVVFILLLTGICYRGIAVSARLQQALLAIEVITLGVLAVMAFVKAGSGHALPGAAAPSLRWLNPWTGSFGSLSDSFLLAVFIYWGWDCALSVNEETKDRARTPGRSAVISTVLLVAIFTVFSMAALTFAGPAFLSRNSGDVLGAMSTLVLGNTAGRLLILCVLTSTAASAQTTIIPTARAVLAMSAHRALPAVFARMHPRFRTPTVATLAMGAVSVVCFVLLTLTSKNVLADSASSVGLLIAFYYGLTGFACTWFFRRELLSSPRNLVFKGILPAVGGLALLAAFVLSIKSYWPASSSYSSFAGIGGIFLIGAGSLLVGVVLMLLARWRLPAFFLSPLPPPAAQPADDTTAQAGAVSPAPCCVSATVAGMQEGPA